MYHHEFSPKDSRNYKGKGSHFIQQEKAVFKELFKQPQTMKQVSVTLGIDRANVCRYVAHFKKNKVVAYLKKVFCPITKHLAWQITTNPNLFPKSTQLTIFPNEDV